MKVSSLEAGATCDALVALAQDLKIADDCVDLYVIYPDETIPRRYQPSTNGGQCFELIEKFGLDIDVWDDARWRVTTSKWTGDTWEFKRSFDSDLPLAICKAVIASKWGDTIPDEIMERLR